MKQRRSQPNKPQHFRLRSLDWTDWLGLTFLIVALCSVFYYIVGPAAGYFHADSADSIVWAKVAADAGRTFDPDFKYAALLPFGANLWMTPLVALFGMNWITQTVSMLIFAGIFAFACLLLAKEMEWSLSWSGLLMGVVFLLLSGSDKLREILWGHVIYYSLGILFVILGLALTFRADRSDKERLSLVLLFLLSFAVATNGIQGLAMFLIPLAGGIVLERVFASSWSPKEAVNRLEYRKLISMTGGTILGLAFLFGVLRRGGISAPYADGYSGLSKTMEWGENFRLVPQNLFLLFGADVNDRMSLMSFDGIVIVFRIFTVILLAVVPIVMLVRYRSIRSTRVKRVLWTHWITVFIILFLVIFGNLGRANWRLVPMLGTAILASVCGLYDFSLNKKVAINKGASSNSERHNNDMTLSPKLLSLSGVIIISVCSLFTAHSILKMPADYGQDNDLHQIQRILQDEGLDYGYATFWQSQALTLLTGENPPVRTVEIDDQGLRIRHYQSSLKWYEDQADVDSYFIVFTQNEWRQFEGTEDERNLSEYLIRHIDAPEHFVIAEYSLNPWHHTKVGFIN